MSEKKENIIVTGGAGFIGSHLVELLVQKGFHVTVIDNFDPFYSKELKLKNIAHYINNPNVTFLELDILDKKELDIQLCNEYKAIVHLAAKAGVRPSISDPLGFYKVNVEGTLNLLEIAKEKKIKQFIFSSSSSVYGVCRNFPWKESEDFLQPISPYAATKISSECMGRVYSKLYGFRFIALRFFTVFGPRQRPDLAINLFSNKIIKGESISFFGNGETKRDYTYVADIVEGVYHALLYDKSSFEIFNLGNNKAISLKEMLATIEEVFQKKAIIDYLPEQPGDVSYTAADIDKSINLLNYNPKTTFRDGITQFKNWLNS